MAQETPAAKVRVIRFQTRGNNKLIEYTLTKQDWLTLLRAVQWEGAPQSAVAWTLLQRFAFLYPMYPTLHKFIEAYAQPINPRWFPDGPNHKEWLSKLKAAGNMTAAEAEKKEAVRRLEKASYSLAKINPKYIALVESMFHSGLSSPIPGSNHYRAPTVQTADRKVAEEARAKFAAAKQMIDNVRVGDPTKDNWFFSVTGSNKPVISLGLKDAVINGARAVVILLIASGAIYWLYQSMQGAQYA